MFLLRFSTAGLNVVFKIKLPKFYPLDPYLNFNRTRFYHLTILVTDLQTHPHDINVCYSDPSVLLSCCLASFHNFKENFFHKTVKIESHFVNFLLVFHKWRHANFDFFWPPSPFVTQKGLITYTFIQGVTKVHTLLAWRHLRMPP